ncbi:hypothetical protein Air01nite_52120 [Asanoa iriomotensis]|uniref:Uncharacterized protein n=1 Tax=Asanoa iriomotensis TaxID=234613 RepID=A0ABQ4C8K8_9ACTN|nr:hypothetical protein Air01nite_52120 [Asanoa iriomotensis]
MRGDDRLARTAAVWPASRCSTGTPALAPGRASGAEGGGFAREPLVDRDLPWRRDEPLARMAACFAGQPQAGQRPGLRGD